MTTAQYFKAEEKLDSVVKFYSKINLAIKKALF